MNLENFYSVKYEKNNKVSRILGIKFSNKINYKNEFLKFKFLPIQKNKIVFSNFCGNNFGCNPKYIALECLKRKLNYDLVWVVNSDIPEEELDIPDGVRVVRNDFPFAIKELATAKIWVSNVRLIKYFRRGLEKKDGQIYIQTWHGSLGIKKIDGDANPKFWERSTWDGYEEVDSKSVDYLISNSKFENEVYKSAFWGLGEIKEMGHPRNDIFFKDTTSEKADVYKKLGIPSDKKILLYVPSYRDDGRLYCYFMNYEKVLDACKKRFGGDWVMCIRLHPRMAEFSDKILKSSENIIDCSNYPDIQELLVSADVAITDYSSCIFDYLLSSKPAFIYAVDIDEFDEERGFYYPFSSTPLSVAKNDDELCENILNFDMDKFKNKNVEFLKDKGCIEDGHAAERVVDFIQELMEK